jgi:hypothetical protein
LPKGSPVAFIFVSFLQLEGMDAKRKGVKQKKIHVFRAKSPVSLVLGGYACTGTKEFQPQKNYFFWHARINQCRVATAT